MFRSHNIFQTNKFNYQYFGTNVKRRKLDLQASDQFLADAVGGDFRDEAGGRKELGAAGGASAA